MLTPTSVTVLFRLSVLLLLSGSLALHAQLVSYTFGPAASPTVSPAVVAEGLQASDFLGQLGSPGLGDTSPLSNGAYFGANTWSGASPGANYFAFTVTPTTDQAFNVAELRFDYRATATGPTTLALRSSADGYENALFTYTTILDATWQKSLSFTLALANLAQPTTFRLHGYGASSNLGTLRVDNVSLHGSFTPVPEPAATTALAGLLALGFVHTRRNKRRKS